MFITNKLQLLLLDNGSVKCEKFNVQSQEYSDYLTENFEIYTQNEKLLFNHNKGCLHIDSQNCHLLFYVRAQHTNRFILVQRLDDSKNLWTKINDKRLALCNILTDQKK